MFMTISVVDFKEFVISKSDPVNDCFVIDARCIRGDKDHVLHSGIRSERAREGKLLGRIVSLINSWMARNREFRVPSYDELGSFVAIESDNGATDATYVDKRCFRGDKTAIGRARHAREKSLMKQIIKVLEDYVSRLAAIDAGTGMPPSFL